MSKFSKALSLLLALAMLCGILPMMTIGSSAAGSSEMQFDANGKFTLMQISDIQDDESVDATTISTITKAIARYNPDLVVFTGDNIKNNVNESDFKKSADSFLQPLIDAGVRYAVTFGNHDDEGLLAASKETQYNYYVGKSSLAVDFDVDNLSGTGSGVIPINSADGTRVAFAIYPMDSGTYDSNDNYDYVKTDQINWYNSMCTTLKARNNGNKVPSLVFQHIPVPEIYNLLKLVTSSTSGAVQGTGSRSSNYYVLDPTNTTITGVMKEGPCPSEVNNGQFASWKSGDSNMVGAFFGHDHKNTFVGTYNGVRMGYCKAATLSSYNDGDPGCRVFEISENGSYTTSMVTNSSLNYEQGEEFLHDEIPGTPSVPKNIIVGASGNGLNKQEFGNTIQLHTVNHKTQALTPVDTSISLNIPLSGEATSVSEPTLAVTAGVSVAKAASTTETDGSTTYNWTLTGGSASAGGTVEYTFNYDITYSGGSVSSFSQKAFSYVENIKSPAGYYAWVRSYRSGDSSGNYLSTKYVMTVLGDSVYGNTREHTDAALSNGEGSVGNWTNEASGYYDYTGSDDGGWKSMGNNYSYGMNWLSPARHKFMDHWTRHNLAGCSPVATIYADKSAAATVTDLGASINFWRSGDTDNGKINNFQGFGIKNGDVGYTVENATVSDTSAISTSWVSGDNLGATRGANKNFSITGAAIPANGTKFTVVPKVRADGTSLSYSTEHWLYTPVLLNFVTYDKTALKTALNVERAAKRQAGDYSEFAFISYESAFKQAYKVVNKVSTNATEIEATLSSLNNAVTNLTLNAAQISDNSAYAGSVTVPSRLYVAGTGYGTATQPAGNTIQPQLLNYETGAMVSASNFSIALPTGASNASVAVTTGTGNAVSVNFDPTTGTGSVTGGTAAAGDYVKYVFTYTIGEGENQKSYTQIAASYVENAPQAAGWLTFIRRKDGTNAGGCQQTTQFVAVKGGAPVAGLSYDVSVTGGTTYGVNFSSFAGTGSQTSATGGKIIDWTGPERYDTGNWYCGRTGDESRNSGGDVTSNRAILQFYIDSSKLSSITNANIFYRSICVADADDRADKTQTAALYAGNVETDGSNSAYGAATVDTSSKTQAATQGASITRNITGSGMPASGDFATLHTSTFNHKSVDLTTHCAWLLGFTVYDKTTLHSKVGYENSVYRQLHDGYSDANGRFTDYQNALAVAMAKQNNMKLTTQENATAADDLQLAVDALEYVLADYTAVNEAIALVYDSSSGNYRPNRDNDPSYFALGTYYPMSYFRSTNEVDIPIQGIDWNLTIQYQDSVDAIADAIMVGWASVTLSDADYTVVDQYLSYKEGTTHSNAGDTIRANPIKYYHYNKQYLGWEHYTADSYAIWADAVTLAENNLDLKIPDQAIVDNCGTQLKRAYLGYNSTTDPDYTGVTPIIIDGLTLKNADYSQLDALIEDINAEKSETVTVVDPSNAANNRTIPFYAPAYTAQIDAKIAEYQEGLYSPEQDEIDALYEQLNTLYAGIGSNLNNADYGFVTIQQNTPADYEFDGANNDIHATYYTDESWAALVAARTAPIAGFQTDEQATVNAYAKAIYDARTGLNYKPADYSSIQEIVDEASTLTQANYRNWSVYQQEENNIVWTYNATEQAKVTIAYNRLATAFYGLVLKDADFTALANAITAGQSHASNAANYTADSYLALTNAITAGQTVINRRPVYDITNQTTIVDPATAAITNAIAGLTFKAANITALQTAYNAAIELPDYAFIDEYGEATWTPVGNAINTAAALIASFNAGTLNITNQTEIDTAATTLTNAVAALPALYADVDYFIGEIPADLTIYTDSSVAALNAAVAAVVRNKLYTEQETVDGYATAIADATANLDLKDADLTNLIEAITAAQAAIAGIDTSWYTDTSWAAYSGSFNAAVAIRDASPKYSILEQDDVDAAETALETATAGLAYKDADYTALDDAIAAAEALTAADYIDFSAVTAAVTAGKVYADASPRALKIDSQTMLDGLAQDITDAIAALELKPLEIHLLAKSGTTTVVDTTNHVIYGLATGLNMTEGNALLEKNKCELDGEGFITYTPAAGNTRYGTGTKVEVFRTGETVPDETYYIVIFGDVTGDGSVNSLDVAELSNYLNGNETTVNLSSNTSPAKFAANLAGGTSLSINSLDVAVIVNYLNGYSSIDQSGAQSHESYM